MPYFGNSYCGTYGCPTKGKEHKSYRFPSPKNQLARFFKWVETAKNPRFANLTNEQIFSRGYACEIHFEEDDFLPALASKRLKRNAFPKLFLFTGK